MQKKYKVIIVGAGPAGIGNAVALKHLGLDENDFVILERDDIGSSLKKWPKEMKFITPSFTGNQFGMVDMNSITPDTSPAFTMRKEHLSGDEYARYLEILVNHYKIPIESGVEVKDVNKENDNFIINTNEGSFTANYLIWCGGEFQFPNLTPFNGSENCIHNTHIDSYKNLDADKYVVIGGYESGIDATVNLAKLDKEVTVIDSGKPWEEFSSDPSAVLSTYTYERLHNLMSKGKIELVSGFRVSRVDKTDNGFTVVSEEGEEIYSEKKPILCTGFNCSTDIIKDLFKQWQICYVFFIPLQV